MRWTPPKACHASLLAASQPTGMAKTKPGAAAIRIGVRVFLPNIWAETIPFIFSMLNCYEARISIKPAIGCLPIPGGGITARPVCRIRVRIKPAAKACQTGHIALPAKRRAPPNNAIAHRRVAVGARVSAYSYADVASEDMAPVMPAP